MSKQGSVTAETHRQLKRENIRLKAEIERLKRGRDRLIETQEELIEENKRLRNERDAKGWYPLQNIDFKRISRVRGGNDGNA